MPPHLMQGFKADNYRGKTVRMRAWLKLDAVAPADAAQMWMRVDLKDRKIGFFDNSDDRPLRSAQWTQVEIVGNIGNDAETINIGVMSIGQGTVWIDSVSFEVVPDGTPLTGVDRNAGAPRNLTFTQGVPGAVPLGWSTVKTKGYSAEVRQAGCFMESACAVVIASPTPEPNMFGNLMQTFGAAAYRGKTVRLRARLKLDAMDANDKAQMWFRVDLPDRKVGFFDNMNDRPVQTSVWTEVEIIGKIDSDADSIYFGVMSLGKGRAWVDTISFDVVPDSTSQTGNRQR